MSKKLTPWFSAREFPTRPGVYQVERRPAGYTGYSMWDGKEWRLTAETRNNAAKYLRKSSDMYHDSGRMYWRGLAEEPK